MSSGGSLVLVATPIGNLGDLSPRAVAALSAAELICCEDTRRTGILLQHAGIGGKRLAIANEHTERSRIAEMLDVLAAGGDVALVSDAGTPAISDPGERLVAAAIAAGHPVSAIPGPAAFVMALVISGLPTGRFVFEGFLPRKGGERRQRLAEIAAEQRTVVFYESPHRVARTLADLAVVCGSERAVVVCRELTKMFETVARGALSTVEIGEPRGEYVVVLAGAVPGALDDGAIERAVDAALAAGASTRDAAAEVAAATGLARNEAYRRVSERRLLQRASDAPAVPGRAGPARHDAERSPCLSDDPMFGRSTALLALQAIDRCSDGDEGGVR